MQNTPQKRDRVTEYYNKYKHLATEYANKVFNYERYGYEKSDVIQELNIKIYMSIVRYSKQWAEYRETGTMKPVPLEYYLRTAMVNKVKDFIKKFNQNNIANIDKISIGEEDNSVDVGSSTTMESKIDLNHCICIINDVDILLNLKGDRKICFSKFLAGFTINELSKEFKEINVNNLIEMHKQYLKTRKKNGLLDFTTQTFQTFHSEE